MARSRPDISTEEILDADETVIDFMELRTGVPNIEAVDMAAFKDLAEYESFMREKMVIRIPQPANENAPWAVYVGSNGAGGWLPYERKIRIPRAYVENLVRSVEVSVHCHDNPDPSAAQGKIHRRRRGSSYPFEVVDHGSRPDVSRRWMQRLINEGRR